MGNLDLSRADPRLPPGNRRFFVSPNASRDPALAADPDVLPALRGAEARLGTPGRLYVPAAAVARAESGLQTGDIVALTDNRPGLDYAHVGLIVVMDGERRFVHASSG